VFIGWRRIFRAQGEFVTSGVYAHIRHPQYLGLIILTFGQLVEWPTLTGLILWPLVVVLYVRLARKEDREVAAAVGEKARAYQQAVPAFLPRRKAGKAAERAYAGARSAAGRTRAQAAAVPAALKITGAISVFVCSFFASTLIVLLAYQWLEVSPSTGARTLGLALIGVLGAAFFAGGLLLLSRHEQAVYIWCSARLETLVGHHQALTGAASPSGKRPPAGPAARGALEPRSPAARRAQGVRGASGTGKKRRRGRPTSRGR